MEGYVYILRSTVLGANVSKIGMTSREPKLRAKELYSGSTGVPLPFKLVESITVGNCKEAERRIHRQLKSYRLNSRREFFLLPAKVAADVAFDVCRMINNEIGLLMPIRCRYECSESRIEDGISLPKDVESVGDRLSLPLVKIPFRLLREQQVGTSELTEEQLLRAKILDELLPVAFFGELTQHSISRDSNPERELKVMEYIAKAFLSIDQIASASEEVQEEAFHLLLNRSLMSSRDVLKDFKLKYISNEMAKQLLDRYELKPYPLLVSKSPR